MSLELRRGLYMSGRAKHYNFTPLLYSTKIDGYDENGVELFNTDAYDLNNAEVNVVDVFNKSTIGGKQAIFSFSKTATSVKFIHNGKIFISETINGIEKKYITTSSNTPIELTSGSFHRYAILCGTTGTISFDDSVVEAIATTTKVFPIALTKARFKQIYYVEELEIDLHFNSLENAKNNVLKIPKYIKKLYKEYFYNAHPSQVVFPEGIERIEKNALGNSIGEVGTLVIPESVEYLDPTVYFYKAKKIHIHTDAYCRFMKYYGNTSYDKEYSLFGKAIAESNGGIGYSKDHDGTYLYHRDTSGKTTLVAVRNNATVLETLDGISYNTGAFHSCKNAVPLGDVYYRQSSVAYLFPFCSKITSAKIASGVEVIGQYAFSNCSNLEKIEIPYGVTTLDKWCFQFCYKLKEVEIPSSVTKINAYAFENIQNMKIRMESTLPNTIILGSGIIHESSHFYVPDEAYDAYIASSNWASYVNNIKKLSELSQ